MRRAREFLPCAEAPQALRRLFPSARWPRRPTAPPPKSNRSWMCGIWRALHLIVGLHINDPTNAGRCTLRHRRLDPRIPNGAKRLVTPALHAWRARTTPSACPRLTERAWTRRPWFPPMRVPARPRSTPLELECGRFSATRQYQPAAKTGCTQGTPVRAPWPSLEIVCCRRHAPSACTSAYHALQMGCSHGRSGYV